MMDRRDFLKTSALASASSLLNRSYASAQMMASKRIAIRTQAPDSLKTRLATRELLNGLRTMHSAAEVTQTNDDAVAGATFLTLTLDASRFKRTEDYEIAASGQGAALRAASEQALLYGVFDFLERQGLVFGIGKDTEPTEIIYFKLYKSQIPVIEQALETAALMLGSDKSRGYCLEMICADFLAGSNLDNDDPTVLLQSMSRFFKFLPGEQRQAFLHEVIEKAS